MVERDLWCLLLYSCIIPIFAPIITYRSSCVSLVFTVLIRTSLVAQLVKNQPAMQETPVQLRVWEDPLEKDLHSMLEKATHSSILA